MLGMGCSLSPAAGRGGACRTTPTMRAHHRRLTGCALRVLQWEAYGHGIANLAPAAATAADGIAVLYNYEAETAVSAALQHDVEAPVRHQGGVWVWVCQGRGGAGEAWRHQCATSSLTWPACAICVLH